MVPRIARFRSAAALRAHLAALESALPIDDTILSAADGSPMAMPRVRPAAPSGASPCAQGSPSTMDHH
jgi:hypothetical protein